jgi:hypothetical protein
MQMKSSGVQAVMHDEDPIVNKVTNTDPMLLTCDNETDIFISKTTKDKFRNLEYTVLSLLLRHHFNCQCVKHNFLSLGDGKLLIYLTNRPLKAKQINSIEIWTDAFINNANAMIDRHHLLAGYSLSYAHKMFDIMFHVSTFCYICAMVVQEVHGLTN